MAGRRLTALCLAAVLAAGEAAALSCVAPDAARAFRAADERPERMIMALGRFSYDPAFAPEPVPRGDPRADRPSRHFTARFTGRSANRHGFVVPLETDVAVSLHCLSVWCGTLPAETETLVFLERRGAGYALDVNPCRGNLIVDPAPQALATALSCLRGQFCAPPE